MGIFSCFTGRSSSKRRQRRASRRSRRRTSANGLTVRTSAIPSLDATLSGYASPRSALSDDDFFDAIDEHNALSTTSISSCGSAGNSPSCQSRSQRPDRTLQSESLVDRFAMWLQDSFFAHSWGASDDGGDAEYHRNDGLSAANATGHASQNARSLHPSRQKVVVPAEDEDGPVAPGCINFLTATQVLLAQRRFLKGARPKAGMSLTQTTSDDAQGAACAWEAIDTSTFTVRSKDYMRTRLKEPAGPALYRLLGVDMYSFDRKMSHIAQHVELPTPPAFGPEAADLPVEQRPPPLLIFNLQLPTYPPSLFGRNEGPGHSLVYYFGLPEGWEPSQVRNPEVLGLLQRFVTDSIEFDGQRTRDRLKLLPRIINIDEWAKASSLSGPEVRLLRNYNTKPLLTRPQQSFYSAPDGSYFEVDLDLHSFAYIARRAYYGYLDRLAPVIFENAFVLQGNRSEELPEVILGAVRVYRVDFTKARPFPAGEAHGQGPSHNTS